MTNTVSQPQSQSQPGPATEAKPETPVAPEAKPEQKQADAPAKT